MFCLESRENMPALEDEIHEALEENIIINNSYGPKEILVENNKFKGMVFKKCLSVTDEDGRFSPKYDDNDTITIEAEHLIIAVGQTFNYGKIFESTNVEFNPNQTVKVDS
jgi:NADPH-dependent glutamate synthase beta subunit-like oxidoreductase